MSEKLAIQDPAETLDYSLDWTTWLGATGDAISTSSWAITPATPTLSGQAVSSNVATCVVAGLALAGVFRLTNTITTNQGRTSDRSITIRAFPQ